MAGLLGVGEGAIAGRWDAVTLHENLGEAFARLQLGGFGRGAEAGHAGCRQVIHNTWARDGPREWSRHVGEKTKLNKKQ